MKTNKRTLAIAMILAILMGVLPISALAGSFSVNGVTVTVPDSFVSCTPSSNIVFDNPLNKTFLYTFWRLDVTTNIWTKLGEGSSSASSLTLPFPYGQVTGTLTFVVNVWVDGKQGALKWTVTCSPPPGGEGCTPGYWRNHPEDWPPTGYAWGDDFDATFGTSYFNPDITLGTAIWMGGGGINRLARHGTAALLSAAHPDVNYPYTVAQVIAMVRAGMADPLAQANELGCSIP